MHVYNHSVWEAKTEIPGAHWSPSLAWLANPTFQWEIWSQNIKVDVSWEHSGLSFPPYEHLHSFKHTCFRWQIQTHREEAYSSPLRCIFCSRTGLHRRFWLGKAWFLVICMCVSRILGAVTCLCPSVVEPRKDSSSNLFTLYLLLGNGADYSVDGCRLLRMVVSEV